MPWVQRLVAFGFWLTVVAIAFVTARHAIRSWGRQRVRGTLIASLSAVLALMLVNAVAHTGAQWLSLSAVAPAGCAALGQLAGESGKGVAR